MPSLESLIAILNALDVSADRILCAVVKAGYTVKNSLLDDKLKKLSDEDKERAYEVVDTLIAHLKQVNL